MRIYGIRYRVEPWDKEPEEAGRLVRPGVRVANDYGYADELFLASILHDTEDEEGSVLLISSKSGGRPSRETLLLVRDQIDHYLEHHSGPERSGT